MGLCVVAALLQIPDRAPDMEITLEWLTPHNADVNWPGAFYFDNAIVVATATGNGDVKPGYGNLVDELVKALTSTTVAVMLFPLSVLHHHTKCNACT